MWIKDDPGTWVCVWYLVLIFCLFIFYWFLVVFCRYICFDFFFPKSKQKSRRKKVFFLTKRFITKVVFVDSHANFKLFFIFKFRLRYRFCFCFYLCCTHNSSKVLVFISVFFSVSILRNSSQPIAAKRRKSLEFYSKIAFFVQHFCAIIIWIWCFLYGHCHFFVQVFVSFLNCKKFLVLHSVLFGFVSCEFIFSILLN